VSDLAVGTEHEPWSDNPLTITDFVRYQGASGDMNPIHHDPGFAAQAGYPSVFAVGMLAAGVLGTYATDWLGPENLRCFRVQFKEQAWPGDVLTYSGKIVDRRQEDAGPVVDVELLCTRQTGGIHIKGWATFQVPMRYHPPSPKNAYRDTL
jgi:acyl dehydratase